MFVLATDIFKKPVFAQDVNEEIGFVEKIIVDPANGAIIGFLIRKPFQKALVVVEEDVIDLTQDGLLINSENSLIPPADVIKIKEILESRIEIIGAKAVTQSGKFLGKIENYLIEIETAQVTRFYIKGGLFSPSLILPIERVVKIEKGRVVFTNEVLGKETTALKEPILT